MNGRTIDIAAYRVLSAKNRSKLRTVPDSIHRSFRVVVLDPSVVSNVHKPEMMQDQPAPVPDIHEVREVQGILQRNFSGWSMVPRRARVLSFEDSEVSSREDRRGVKCWSCNTDPADPTDCPPAA